MQVQQLSVFVENKEGRLAEITGVLAKAGVDIRAVSVADTREFGILRLIVDKPDTAHQALQQAGFTASLTSVIVVSLEDKPGEFARVLSILAEKHLGVEYMYAFISRDQGHACVILRVKDNESAAQVLHAAGVRLLSGEEIQRM